jgi:hypothetical protein
VRAHYKTWPVPRARAALKAARFAMDLRRRTARRLALIPALMAAALATGIACYRGAFLDHKGWELLAVAAGLFAIGAWQTITRLGADEERIREKDWTALAQELTQYVATTATDAEVHDDTGA